MFVLLVPALLYLLIIPFEFEQSIVDFFVLGKVPAQFVLIFLLASLALVVLITTFSLVVVELLILGNITTKLFVVFVPTVVSTHLGHPAHTGLHSPALCGIVFPTFCGSSDHATYRLLEQEVFADICGIIPVIHFALNSLIYI